VGARGRTVSVDASFGSIWDRFDFGVMGTFEAHKGDLVFLGDMMYISLSNDRQTPGDLFSGIKTKSKLFMLDPEVGYRALNVEGGSIDLLVGVRYWHTKNSLTFQAGRLPQVDASQSRDWADLVFGARGIMRLSPRLYLSGKFDVGGFGISSDLTGQAFGGVGINVKPRLTIVGGYRYLFVNYKSGGFTFNAAMSGPIVGAKFKF
jgi:outer membrane receptor protein involved in Fe transport